MTQQQQRNAHIAMESGTRSERGIISVLTTNVNDTVLAKPPVGH